MKNIEGIIDIERFLNRKIARQEKIAFTEINRKAFPEKPNSTTIKNVLTSSFMMLAIKMKETK